MKNKEEIEKRIAEYEQQYNDLDKKGSKDLPIFDITAHYRKMAEIQKAIDTLKWVIAIDFPTQEKIKELAESYHDREVMSYTYAGNQKCDCCGKIVTARVCIEHDSQDYSKDKQVCSDCYVAIATYWKEHSPKKICPV